MVCISLCAYITLFEEKRKHYKGHKQGGSGFCRSIFLPSLRTLFQISDTFVKGRMISWADIINISARGFGKKLSGNVCTNELRANTPFW